MPVPCVHTASMRTHTPFLFDSGRRRIRGDSRARHAHGRLNVSHGGGGAGVGLFSTGIAAATTASWRARNFRPTTPALQADEPEQSPWDAGEDAHLRQDGRVVSLWNGWSTPSPPNWVKV